ncbi:MAG: COG4315 family predicted lipoprotein [Actinomycetota bacterium]
MKFTQTARTALLAAGMLVLAGCGGGSGTEEPAATQAPPASESGLATESASPQTSEGGPTGGEIADAAGTLTTAETNLGEIVVDGAGMTVYYFTKDVPDSGKSACTGDCLAAWPPVLAETEPKLDGVTAKVGLIDTPDGKHQVTLNGMPIYYWAQDKAPGDTTGQDVNEVWYVVAPNGDMIK